ncbi:AAA family ATPase [Spirosoma endophyticum]|uniref:ATPase family associated with various cellular activities (AAA) n=1 Tax=Spirosoma endophyticum TaxID=662367 RepID=A0A1I2FW98_9BACT|nr:ATP-binding protein [Spirosoma endophyticum]SFF09057.1 ATPase family associated with various cellular activities (AAA) [Spirosoma endophyticum]
MNQELLTRLFKSMEGDHNSPLFKVAYSIIEEEKQKGHGKLAERLNSILVNKEKKVAQNGPALKLIKDGEYKVPVDRRYKLPLARHIEHDYLRHEMVLSEDVEKKIIRIEKEHLGRERLAHHGLKPRRKILFYGSSGCGKTMAAERIAWDLGLPFYKVRFDSIISSYLGESASNLKSLFESIVDYPCVVLLDEFDIIGKQRNVSSNEVGEIHRIVNVLLGLLEEYDGERILVATTNLESSLDKALFRRFDDIVEFQKPKELDIENLLKISFSALKINKQINLKEYSEKMVGLSYAIIVKIANDAAKKSIINLRSEISKDDIDSAFLENVDHTK